MISANDIRERIARKPFLPFRIRTSSGDSYDVLHPEFVIVMKRLLVVATPATNWDVDEERAHVLSILHVTALESLPQRSKKKQST
jgi:hypothetical protein